MNNNMSTVNTEQIRSFTGFPIDLARVPWTERESEIFLNEYKNERNFHVAAERTGSKNAAECEAWYLFLCRLDLLVNACKLDAPSGTGSQEPLSGDQLSEPKSNDDEDGRAKKRQRKKATAIQRKFKCPADDCPRAYGTEGALKYHFKRKHSPMQWVQQAPRTPPQSPTSSRANSANQLLPLGLQSNTHHYIQIPGLGLAAVEQGNGTSGTDADGNQTMDANAANQAIQFLVPLEYIYMQTTGAPGTEGTVEELQHGSVQAVIQEGAEQTADQVPDQTANEMSNQELIDAVKE